MDLNKIYSLRKKFSIIAITGQTGSGCTDVAKQLSIGFKLDKKVFPKPIEFGYDHNSYRKYRIVYEFASKNFKPFAIIYYRDILTAFILKYSFKEFVDFLESDELKSEFKKSKLITIPNFQNEIKKLLKSEKKFLELHKKAKDIINDSKKNDEELAKLFQFFESSKFKKYCSHIHAVLRSESLIKRNKTLQIIANNLRGLGYPYSGKHGEKYETRNVYTIAEIIKSLIKAINSENNKKSKNTKIVIDSLRNPFEIMFFRQRYSAFYTLAINREKEEMDDANSKAFGKKDLLKKDHLDDMLKILKEEHSGVKLREFYKQNVSFCIQNADIHLAFKTKKEAKDENKKREEKKDNKTSPYYSWGMQLLKYIALIDHPGLITPSPEERCMQLAYTAKYNSGCISRQVGAAITDENY